MPRLFCPHLPEVDGPLAHGALLTFGSGRDRAFFLTALQMAQGLWRQGLAGRSLLILDRAMACPAQCLSSEDRMPFAAVDYIVRHGRADELVGNPVIHFSHLATRLKGEDNHFRRARAWACYDLVRRDPRGWSDDSHRSMDAPTHEEIIRLLEAHSAGEAREYVRVLEAAGT